MAVFISYRRADSDDITGRIYDHLSKSLGREQVFKDVDSIPFGTDFREAIATALSGDCHVVLVIIGPTWVSCTGQDGKARLDNLDDFVRVEIETAMENRIRIIPVLVRDAFMPTPEQLPHTIATLPYLNATQIRADPDFINDIARLKSQLVAGGAPNSIGMQMLPIPAGEFWMGSPDLDGVAYEDEKPQHLVKITQPFFLSEHAVTWRQYEQIVGTHSEKNKAPFGPDCPKTNVSWFDAVAFCNRLSEQEGIPPYYTFDRKRWGRRQMVSVVGGAGYHLPTEAQWEYACRAGTTTSYSFGDDVAELINYAWYYENTRLIGEFHVHPVRQKLPSPWGLYDIHGNVFEWTQGWDVTYSREAVSDPLGSPKGIYRVLRGGSFRDHAKKVCSTSRSYHRPENTDASIGFRPARSEKAV